MTEKPDYTKLFEYYSGMDQLPEGGFKISPSSLEDFFSDKRKWYAENLEGADKSFIGNNSTVAGTAVHAAAEVVANSIMTGEEYDSPELIIAIEDYIDSRTDIPDYDSTLVRSLWQPMAEQLIGDYVVNANTVATEEFLLHELLPGIFVGGTYDAITSTVPNDSLTEPQGELTVRDYKTASKKPTSFSWKYTLQAYTYAYMLHQIGVPIREVELCYVIRATKTLPIRTFRFVKPFDEYAYAMIENILMLVADSVDAWNKAPELRYLLAGDYRLK